jgi:hypothetical protein
MASWKLTIRNGPRVERARFDSLEDALAALERRLDELAPDARRGEIQVFRRTIEPAQQVAVRAELAGPGRAYGGIDLHGDGSSVAFSGQRWRRAPVERRRRERGSAR